MSVDVGEGSKPVVLHLERHSGWSNGSARRRSGMGRSTGADCGRTGAEACWGQAHGDRTSATPPAPTRQQGAAKGGRDRPVPWVPYALARCRRSVVREGRPTAALLLMMPTCSTHPYALPTNPPQKFPGLMPMQRLRGVVECVGAPQRGAGGRESTLRLYRRGDRADVGWRAAQDAAVPAARARGAGRRARGHAARCSNASGMVQNGVDRYPTED